MLPLVDRLGGWVDVALGELAVRVGGQVPAADDSGRLVPVRAWLRDTTLCGGSAAGTQVQLAKLLRQLPEIADAVLTGQVSQASAAVLTRLIGNIELEQLLASQPALIEVAAGRGPTSPRTVGAGADRHALRTPTRPRRAHRPGQALPADPQQPRRHAHHINFGRILPAARPLTPRAC